MEFHEIMYVFKERAQILTETGEFPKLSNRIRKPKSCKSIKNPKSKLLRVTEKYKIKFKE